MLKEELQNISIDDLLILEKISKRAFTCCENAQFKTLYDIISFYLDGNSFERIRNSGQKTRLELENLCKINTSQIEDLSALLKTKKDSLNEEFDVETLSISQRELIKKKYLELINNCTVRTFNGLKVFSVEEFIKSYLYCNKSELFKIKNIGKKSVEEILKFRNDLSFFINDIINIEDSPIKGVKLDAINKYGNLSDNDFVFDFYQNFDHLPMLWIFEQLIKNDDSRENKILLNTYSIFNEWKISSLDEMAKKNNLSRERIRQLRIKAYSKIFKKTSILFQNKEDLKYLRKIFRESDIVCQESIEIKNILSREKCNFNHNFVLQLIAFIFQKKYTIIGKINSPIRTNKIWQKTFIVKKKYSNIFDLEKFREEVSNIIKDCQVEYLFDIDDYVVNSKHWTKFNFNKVGNIIKILREILLHEFQLYSDNIEGKIKIPANKEKKTQDIIYEILKNKGNPMHVDEIYLEFKKILPEHKYTDSSQLRPYLQKHEKISFRNRKSLYTLKEWKHIRTGTIRDTIIDYLSKNELPQTVDDITNHVLQYFPNTNISSIRTSMLIDTKKRFCFFNNNLFGLEIKEYPPKYQKVEQPESQRKSFEQRLRDMETFIIKKEHFPFTTSVDNKESSLGRWWYRIKNNKQTLNESKQAEVERVKAKYSGYLTDKTTFDWYINYNKLKDFIHENRRLPLAQGDEKFLYGWFQRAKRDFHDEKLTEEQRQKLINLGKFI